MSDAPERAEVPRLLLEQITNLLALVEVLKGAGGANLPVGTHVRLLAFIETLETDLELLQQAGADMTSWWK